MQHSIVLEFIQTISLNIYLNMGKRNWSLLRKYCLEITPVGLKYFYLYPDILSRCFWAINLIFSLILSAWITRVLYFRFFETPTRINIENQREPILNMPYPSITLCPPTQVTVSSVKYFNKSLVEPAFSELNTDLEGILPLLMGFYNNMGELKEDDLKELQDIFDQNRFTIPEVMAKIPLSCEKFLKKCIFERKVYNCEDLFQPIMTSYGYCCTFNNKYYFDGKKITTNPQFKNHTVNGFGLEYTLTVISDYEPKEVLKNTLYNAGATQVLITDLSEYPTGSEYLLVNSGGEANVLLRATYTYCSDDVATLLPESRGCNFEHEQYVPSFRGYRSSDCFHSCYLKAIQKACNCLLFYIPIIRSQNICKLTDLTCIIAFKQNWSSWVMSELCNCPRDCVFWNYRAELNMGNFDAIPYMIQSPNLYRDLTFNKSSSILKFLFLSSTYVKQKQETIISFSILMSNLGGVFGLFLGCSGISVLEILFYIYQGIKNYIQSTRLERNRNAVN